ncbi:uncharacterized protein LOC129582946 [Paramacrobiotus metropolitanus]|uniref:uncharacterized protein LOC129582946 n=1 Tax=Paramacrobiotus metropolitanus TaxID=2943436 RepID=UPI0024461EAA|nr:uncharacterized protein LOC129582946 [Paramacrobiotus metropolitanus]
MRRWKQLSTVLGVASFLAVLIFEVVDWLNWLDRDPRRWNMAYNQSYMPLRIPGWLFIIIWTFFNNFPYILSQQLYISLLLYSRILKEALTDIHRCLPVRNKKAFEQVTGQRVEEKTSISYPEVKMLKHRYLDVLRCSSDLNGAFGNSLFVIYGLDLLAMCGFVAAIATDKEPQLSAYLVNYVSVVVFSAYISCMGLMAGMHEECQALGLALYEAMEQTETGSQTAVFQMESYVGSFITLVRDHPVVLTGADIFHVTRSFLVGTVTFIISSTILLSEISERTKTTDETAGSHNFSCQVVNATAAFQIFTRNSSASSSRL